MSTPVSAEELQKKAREAPPMEYLPFLNQPVSPFIKGPGPEIVYERQDGHMVFVGGD